MDHVVMDLDGCYTMVDLVRKIELYLKEEFGSDEVSYVDVSCESGEEFRLKEMKMKQLRLLPGPGRERSFMLFLGLLTSAPSQAESRSFRFSIYTKKTQNL
jgi:hypothetical protein